MPNLLTDRIALVPWTGSGIGAAVAHRFAREAATFWLNDVRPDPLSGQR